jgi:hypothetical protein
MAIRTKLTVRDDTPAAAPAPAESRPRREVPEAERALRKERVAAAKDAMKRSAGLKGDHVASARAAIKLYLQRLNEPRQPDDAMFKALLEAPFHVPPKKKERH